MFFLLELLVAILRAHRSSIFPSIPPHNGGEDSIPLVLHPDERIPVEVRGSMMQPNSSEYILGLLSDPCSTSSFFIVFFKPNPGSSNEGLKINLRFIPVFFEQFSFKRTVQE